jgi:hypothetical protein
MNTPPGEHEDTKHSLDTIIEHSLEDPSSFIPTEPPQPTSLWIDLVSLDDLVDPIPDHNPQPESLFLELHPLEKLLPPTPEVVPETWSMDVEFSPEQETLPSSPTSLDERSRDKDGNLLCVSISADGCG